MKKFFSFFVLIIIIGLACSLVPLSLRFRLHKSEPELPPNSAISQENLAVYPEENHSITSSAPGSSAKGEVIAGLTPAPFLMETKEAGSPVENELTNSHSFEYTTQMLTPVFISNFVHEKEGCNWLGIGGQIFDINNQPVEGMVVAVTGKPEYTVPAALAYSGLAPDYGPGGYEVFLGNENRGGEYKVQLFDPKGSPLSAEASVTVPAGCDSNLIIINFIDSSKSNTIFLPIISH